MEPTTQSDQQSLSPVCSIIIPTKDKLEFLKPCVETLLASNDIASTEVIIVNNKSIEAETKKYLQSLSIIPNIRVLNWNDSFNFSAINNFAVKQSRSDYICFLNNDIEIKDPLWLGKLLDVAKLNDVGAVGCTLLYPDSSIQHAGIVLDGKTIAQHIAIGENSNFIREQGITLPYAVDAVTAACLVMRKSLFLRIGGFNEEKLSVAFNDVDLCLRLADKGLPVLSHPGVVLIHHESATRQSDRLPANRKRALKEHDFMLSRWHTHLINHSFSPGIPDRIRDAALLNEKLPAPLTEIARKAADRLYLQDCASRPNGEEIRDICSTAAALSEAQDYVSKLQSDYKNLEAHTERLQHAHELIENSIFWRMTYPLRLLRNTVAPGSEKQSAVNETLAIKKPKQVTRQNEGQQLEKQKLDNSAKGALDKFLTSAELLQFPEAEAPQLSIILVFYQQAHLSYLCLLSLLEFADVCYELVIVDNNSTDKTVKLLNKIDNATIIRNADNLGFVKAVNQAAEIATGEYILLLNNDALIEKNTLSNALQVIESDKSVGAVGAKIKLLDGSIQEAGSIIFSDGACLGYGRGNTTDNYEFMFQRDVDYCSGAFLLFRNSSFKALGGFDLDYAPAYYEESDFCIRLQKKGLRIVYVPSSQITHYEFASCGGAKNAKKMQAMHRGVLCTKHADYLAERFVNDDSKILHARTRNNFPNILVIDDRVPHPSLGAGYPRCSGMLLELSKMDFNISFYPLLFPKEHWDDVYNTLPNTIEVILESGHDGLQSFLAERNNFYQFVVVSRVHNMEFFNYCLSLEPELLGDTKIIYDAEAVSAPREILCKQFLGQDMSTKDQEELIDNELQQSKQAEKIVAVSKNEAEIFKRHGYNNTVVLGHTIASKPGSNRFMQRSGLLFVGALRDEGSPNVDSLLWFLINVFPIIEQAIPDIKLNIVGDNSAPSLATIGKDNIYFTGRLDSIEEMYNRSRVFIAPTRFAAGIPHKIHEAAAMGLPSVTTELLSQQLGWRDGKELLVGNTPEAYAAQCIKLYQDQNIWQNIRNAGLTAITKDCSQETFRENLAGLFT